MRLRRLVFLASVALLVAAILVDRDPVALGATIPADTQSDLRAVLHKAFEPDEPGAAAIVVKEGQVLLREARGLANVELGVPIAPDSVFRIGSVTKQFTAAAVLLLAQDGKLAVGDDITKYLTDYPARGRAISIEHLLTHTSGIPSYTGLAKWRPLISLDKSVQEMIDLFKDEAPEFEPGQRFLYNNSGYFLLGAIIEKVSGRSYEAFVKERIFGPLAMKQTSYDRPGPIIPKRAAGYARRGSLIVNADYVSMTQPFSAGALASTVDDLAKWDRALYGDAILTPASRERMFTAYSLKTGESAYYGYGWGIGRYEGHVVTDHGGGINGFTCHVIRIPEARVYAAVLTNQAGGRSPQGVARQLAAIAMGKPVTTSDAMPSEQALEQYVGVYRADGPPPVVREVVRKGAVLSLQRTGGPATELVPVRDGQFYARDTLALVSFEKDPSGRFTTLVIDNWGRIDRARRQ